MVAATFGWLCVETHIVGISYQKMNAATFGWLCVETFHNESKTYRDLQPPSGGCVLKLLNYI